MRALAIVATCLGLLAGTATPGRAGVGDFFARLFGRAEARCELGDAVVGGQVEPGAQAVVVPLKKKAWEASLGGEAAARPYVRARLAGWPNARRIDPATLPRGDRELVQRVARDTWRGLQAFTDREHHLPIDTVRLDDAHVGDYTNVTSVGLRLIAIVAARDLGLVGTSAAVAELRGILDTLGRLETHAGFFFNYYDTTSLERTSNFISFVDSSWLTAGLMVVRSAVPALADACTRLLAPENYRFFYDDALGRMSHGYYVQLGARSRYHYGVFYAESRLGSLIAIGKGDVPEAHWFSMARTFAPACRWQTQPPHARTRKRVRGHPVVGGYYEWQDVRFVPSWGGSMFEAIMPTLVLDESRYAPKSLGANDVAHVSVQRRYAEETLGYPVWGISPCVAPSMPSYGEYGVKVLGSLGYAAGAVTPHASALALGIAPADAIRNLRRLAERYDIYGDFGFYDAVEPMSGQVAHTYLALDQSMTFIAAANYLCDDCVRRYFAADPIAEKALATIGDERFFE